MQDVDYAKEYSRCLELKPFPSVVILAIGEDEWRILCDGADLKDRNWLMDGELGSVHAIGAMIIVRLSDLSGQDPIYSAGICAHEATHAFQMMCEFIGESSPSIEFQAYYIQHISTWLMKELKCSLFHQSTSNSSDFPSLQESSDSTSSVTGEQAAS